MLESQRDPLAIASEVPNVNELFAECERANFNQLANLESISSAEAERYQVRDGKDGTGQLWQKNLGDKTKTVKPYDGAPDPDASLTDEIAENEVDLDLVARAQGVLGTSTSNLSPLTANQAGELVCVARFVQRAIEDDLVEDEELLAQMKANNGMAVLNPGWRERWELVERDETFDSLMAKVQEAAGPDAAKSLAAVLLDPTLEAAAIEQLQALFAYLPKARVRSVVRDLRETGAAKFLDKQLVEKRPTIRTLIPGFNYFVSGASGKIERARLHLVIERFYEAELRAVAAESDWNPAFVDAVVETVGKYSNLGEGLRTKEQKQDLMSKDSGIEIWTAYVLQFDEQLGAAGMFCTTFSPHILPSRDGLEETTDKHYARHYLLDYAHRQPPFVLARREVTGPGMFDTRSVPDITRSNNNVIRNLQKSGLARAHLEVDPPRALVGTGWKLGGGGVNTPGKILENLLPNAQVQDLSPARGNPQLGELAIERVERGTHRLFAFPDADVHPARWQPRALRKARRALMPWRQAITQLVVLCYQNFNSYELAQIIGRFPQLSLEDVLRHRITLTFDPRGLDNDWRKDALDTLIKLLGVDKGGLMDTTKIIELIGSLFDPTMIESIIRDPQSASAALYRKVQNAVNDIMLGNPPPMVEMDASAGMQLQMVMQIVSNNPKFQQVLSAEPAVAENLKTYVKNLQHSQQETQLSPQQGRLGVAELPQRPVQVGAAGSGMMEN